MTRIFYIEIIYITTIILSQDPPFSHSAAHIIIIITYYGSGLVGKYLAIPPQIYDLKKKYKIYILTENYQINRRMVLNFLINTYNTISADN